VREANGSFFILAAKREGAADVIRLKGLDGNGTADVLYENRKVPVRWGVIEDEFKPNAVHVYRISE
jgi:hypothetical protein